MGFIYCFHYFFCISGDRCNGNNRIFSKMRITNPVKISCIFKNQRNCRSCFFYNVFHLSCIKDSSSDSDIKNIFESFFADLVYYFLCLCNNANSVFVFFSDCLFIKVKHCSILLRFRLFIDVTYCIMTYYIFQPF